MTIYRTCEYCGQSIPETEVSSKWGPIDCPCGEAVFGGSFTVLMEEVLAS